MKPRHLIFGILALLVAYPLSFGPVVRWYYQQPVINQFTGAIETFYRPLFVLCTHGSPVGMAMKRYVELWVPSFGVGD
jgi:hypothetical protein